jgi:hypothetical protein
MLKVSLLKQNEKGWMKIERTLFESPWTKFRIEIREWKIERWCHDNGSPFVRWRWKYFQPGMLWSNGTLEENLFTLYQYEIGWIKMKKKIDVQMILKVLNLPDEKLMRSIEELVRGENKFNSLIDKRFVLWYNDFHRTNDNQGRRSGK